MKLFHIAAADLRRVAKDRKALIWLLLMPLAMTYVFGSALGGGGRETTWFPVINLDQHELSAIFLDQLRQDGYNVDLESPAAQQDLKHKWPYGVVIPSDFSASILRGQSIKIPLVKGDAAADRFIQVQSHLLQAIVRFTRGLATVDACHRPWDNTSRAALEGALARPQLLTVSEQSFHTLRPPPAGFSQSLSGMLVMFVMQMVLSYGGASLVRDRNGGRLRRMFAAPVPPAQTYAGKILARMAIACTQAAVLLGAGATLFHQPLGDHPLFLIPVVVCVSAFAGCMSVLAGMVCQTEKQVMLAAIFSAMLLAALGGCWWPIEVVPDSFKTIASFTPSYWAMHALQSILYFGKDYQVLWLDCPILLGYAALFGLAAIAAARFLGRRGALQS